MDHIPTAFRLLRSFAVFTLFSLLVSACSESGNPEKDQRTAESHLTNAANYAAQGQYRAAMLEVRNAIKKAPSTKTIGTLSDIYTELGQYRAAQALLEANVETFPDLNLKLAETYVSMAKFYSAEEAMAKVNKAQTDPIQYGLLKAKITFGIGETDTAIALINQLRQQHPNNKDIQLAHFLAVFKTGTPQQSEDTLNNLVTTFTDAPDVLLTAAKVRFLQKNYPATEEHLMNALHLAPQTDIMTPVRSGILNLLSKTLTQQGRYADAMPFNKILKDANPDVEDIQTRLETAFKTIKSGDIKGGEELLEKLRQDFPNIGTTDALLGLINLEQGDASKASDLFDKSVDPETAAPNLSAAAAMAELRLDEKQKALDILETALKSNPESLQLQTLYGLAAISDSELNKKGAAALEKALELGASDFRIYTVLAAYYGTDQKDKTREILNKAASTFSTTEEQLKIYGSYVQYDMKNEAEGYASELKTKQSNNEAGWLMTAAADMLAKNYTKAQQSLNKAVTLNPKSEKGWFLLGANELNLQNWDNASQAFKKAIVINPEASQYLQGLLMAESQKQSDWATIENTFLNISSNDDHKIKIYGFIIQRALDAGKQEDADRLINDFKNLANSTAEQITYLETRSALVSAGNDARTGRANAAIATLENAIKKYPTSVEMLVRLGNLYLQQGELEKSEQVKTQIGSAGDKVMATLFDADILSKSAKHDEALNLLKQFWATEKDGRVANAIYMLSAQQKIEVPNNFLEEWRKTDPKNARPVLLLAMNTQGKDADTAITLYEQALRLAPKDVAALNNLAWIYQEKGKLEQANKLASYAVSLAPNNASVLDTAGYIKMKMGDRDAIKLLEKALELEPGSKEIKQHLDQAKMSL